jgi:hypothetical protein
MFLVMQTLIKKILRANLGLSLILILIDKMEYNLRIHSINNKIQFLKLLITNNHFLIKMKL